MMNRTSLFCAKILRQPVVDEGTTQSSLTNLGFQKSVVRIESFNIKPLLPLTIFYRHWRSVAGFLAGTVLAGFFVTCIQSLSAVRGPFWLGFNSDPSYVYLLNGLLVADGVIPYHTDHPGTPLQLIISLLLQIFHGFPLPASLVRAVITNPEQNLEFLQCSLAMIAAAALIAMVTTIASRTKDVWLAVAAGGAPLLFFHSYAAVLKVNAESFLITPCLLFVATNVVILCRSCLGVGEGDRTRLILAFAVTGGLAVSTKVHFAPLLLLALAGFPLWRERIVALLLSGASALLFLLPIITEIPRTIKTWFQFAAHSGRYGSGPGNVIQINDAISAIEQMYERTPHFFVLLALTVALGVSHLWLGRKNGDLLRIGKVSLLVVGVQCLSVLLVAKHPGEHYLVPVMISASLNVALILIMAQVSGMTGRWVIRVGLCLVACWGAANTAKDFLQNQKSAREQREQALAGYAIAAEVAPGKRVDYYSASSPEYALHFGQGYTLGRFDKVLAQQYPESLFFNIYNGNFERFLGPLDPGEALAEKAEIYFYGAGVVAELVPPFSPKIPPDWDLREFKRAGMGVLHIAEPRGAR